VSKTLEDQLYEARERLAQRESLTERVPKLRDAVGQCEYRLRFLEVSLEHALREIEQLSSTSIGGLIDSLLGRREKKLNERKAEAQEIQAQFVECIDALKTMTDEFEQAGTMLEKLQDAEDDYRRLLDEKRHSAADNGDGVALQLAETELQLENAKEIRRRTQKAVEIAEAVRQRVQTMTKALGRAKTGMTFGRPASALLNLAARHGASHSMKNAEGGMNDLHRAVLAIDLNPDVEIDAELLRVAADLDAARTGLVEDSHGRFFCVMGMASPLLDRIQEALGLLRMKLDLIEPEYKQLDQERQRLIEEL